MLAWLKRFRRKEQDSGIGLLMAEMQRDARLREHGWVPFVDPPPGSPSPFGRLIDIIDQKGEIWTTEYDRIPPMWNVWGKYWRVSKFSEPGRQIGGRIVSFEAFPKQ